MGSPDAIVIGAGFAGLSAATALAESGARVLVLEARPGLGGRAASFRDPGTGERVDNGQHVLMGCYTETLRFLDRIGCAGRVRWRAGLSVPMVDRSGRETTLSLPPLPAPFHLLGGVLAWEALSWRERLSVIGFGAEIARGARPDESVRQWLSRAGQAARLVELLWEPLALAALNQSIDRAAAPHFATVLGRIFGPDPSSAALVLPAVPLDELYALPARDWLRARGGDVRVQAPATLVVENGRAAGVRVRGDRIDAGVVISSVPWHGVGGLFEEPPDALSGLLGAAAALGSEPIVTVNLWLDRPVMDDVLVGLPGRRFQWVFDRRALVGGTASHVSLTASGAADIVRLANHELVAAALEDLRGALPAAAAATIRRASAVREKRSTFSLAPGAPPRPATATPVAGFVLAGDWIATGLPATIESAVVSGHRAALSARAC